MEASANGKNNFHLKCPPFKNNRKEVRETNRFKISAVGFITSGAKAYKAIKAKYPLAPPCPTDAYNNATIKSKIKNVEIIILY